MQQSPGPHHCAGSAAWNSLFLPSFFSCFIPFYLTGLSIDASSSRKPSLIALKFGLEVPTEAPRIIALIQCIVIVCSLFSLPKWLINLLRTRLPPAPSTWYIFLKYICICICYIYMFIYTLILYTCWMQYPFVEYIIVETYAMRSLLPHPKTMSIVPTSSMRRGEQ